MKILSYFSIILVFLLSSCSSREYTIDSKIGNLNTDQLVNMAIEYIISDIQKNAASKIKTLYINPKIEFRWNGKMGNCEDNGERLLCKSPEGNLIAPVKTYLLKQLPFSQRNTIDLSFHQGDQLTKNSIYLSFNTPMINTSKDQILLFASEGDMNFGSKISFYKNRTFHFTKIKNQYQLINANSEQSRSVDIPLIKSTDDFPVKKVINANNIQSLPTKKVTDLYKH